MRRLGVVLLVLAACTTASSDTTLPAVTSTITLPSTSAPATTTPSQSPTTTTTAPPTTTTLRPLESLRYDEVGRIDFPIHMVPWAEPYALLATKDGRVWLFTERGGVSESPILDLRAQVRDSGEQGLLAVAVHPDDPVQVFLHYTANDGDTVVSRFTWEDGSLASEEVLFRLDQPAGNHNGGMIQFGPDGRLFLGLGDGGGANDRFGHGQNRDTLLGGLVALDVDDPDAEPILFNYGLRNPWRFWIEGEAIYVADVGQGSYEEITVTELIPEVNFGWPITEGNHCFRPSSACDTAGITLPIVEVPHGDAGTCSITGGLVYRGSEIPELDGVFLYSDYCGGYLRGLLADGESVDYTDQVGNAGRVASFGLDWGGELYVLTTERILKLVPVRR